MNKIFPCVFIILYLIIILISCNKKENIINNEILTQNEIDTKIEVTELPDNNISKICLPKDDGTYMKLELTGNKDYYKYSYRNLMIDILYYDKKYNGPYDDVYDDVNIEYI